MSVKLKLIRSSMELRLIQTKKSKSNSFRVWLRFQWNIFLTQEQSLRISRIKSDMSVRQKREQPELRKRDSSESHRKPLVKRKNRKSVMPCFRQEKKLLKVKVMMTMMKVERMVLVNLRVDQKPVDLSLKLQSQDQDLKSSVNLILSDQVEQNLKVTWVQTRKKRMTSKKMV